MSGRDKQGADWQGTGKREPAALPRDAAATKQRIVAAAAEAFARRGFSQTGVREIAADAGVASSLVIKHFATKANLFREALRAAFAAQAARRSEKAGFGELLTRSVADPDLPILAPAMIALSLGDAEARQAAQDVVREDVIAPLAAWLGGEDAQARAACLLMLSTGFAIYARHLDLGLPAEALHTASKTIAACVQQVVETDTLS